MRFKYDLAREAATWASDGLIPTSRAEAICSRYGADYHNLSRRSLGYQRVRKKIVTIS